MNKPALLSEEEQAKRLAELNANAASPWEIKDGKLLRRYDFKDFVEAFGFMAQAALECEKLCHHPRWVNVWNVVEIGLYTHKSGGITHLDFELAGQMEPLAKRFLA
ncbi:MAG TPA: pterin-4-alpha-carbinolamine dehydratase [Porticoccaceae bacterium]|nr:pterin-4-alpha-carbinolamine dehydratase [Porticoccaceae bacterium]